MALNYKSQTYNQAKSALAGIKAEKGSLTQNDINAVARSLEVDAADIRDAAQDEKNALAGARDFADKLGLAPDDERRKELETYFTTENYSGPFERMFRRAVGATADAAGFIGEAVLPDEVLNRTEQAYEYVIPKSIRKDIQGFLDPYHGKGIMAGVEEVGGTLASYALPVGTAVKVGEKVARSTPFIANTFNRLGSKGKTLAKAGGYGVAWAAGATAIEDPRENPFDLVRAYVFEDAQAMERLKQLAENPDDVEAKDYLDAFIRNLAIEGLFGAGVHSAGSMASALARSYRQGSLSSVRNTVTQIGDTTRGAARPFVSTLADITEKPRRRVGQYLGSRMGTDDNFLRALLKRETIDEQSVIRADGFATELQKSIDDTLPEQYKTDEFYRDVINEALAGNEDRIRMLQDIAPEVAENVRLMRNELDSLSARLPVGGGNLRATIDSNMGVYLNRSYDFFESPAYRKELQKRILKRPENIQRERLVNDRVRRGEITREEGDALIDGLTDNVIDNAADYVARQLGVARNNPIVQDTLEKLAKTEDASTFSNFMESLAGKNKYASSSKPLMSRKDIDVSIRDLLGEVKDPAKNFTNTYIKLANMNAQYDFMEEVASHLSIQFQNKVRKLRERNPNLTQDEAIRQVQRSMVELSSDVGADKKLKWIFEGANRGDVANPLQGVYADKAYADAIKKGFDVTLEGIRPTLLKNIIQGYAGLKGSSQFAKTVLNIPTHGKNMIGNVVMLTANGILPTGTSISKAVKTTANQLRNKNNRELADQLAEYVELGITNSGVGLGIVRRNLNEAFKDSDGYLSKVTGFNRAKAAGKKIADVYQAEDDFFKIIHFERTKDYLKKVYPTLDDNAIKQMAAQRTRDMMPNYRLVPRAIKMTGYSPVGDFVAFPAEMIRTSKNLAKYTFDDIRNAGFKASDENFNANELRKVAATRLAGMTVAGSFGDVVHNASMAMFGITEEQDKSMSLLGAPYYVNQDRVYLGPIEKDEKTGHVISPLFYLGSYDPYNIVKIAARGVHQALLEGKTMSDVELDRLATGTLEQTLYPIVGPSMITETISDIYSGKQDYDMPAKEFLANSLSMIVDLYDPGYKKFFERRADYENSGMSDNFFTIAEGDVDVPAFFGFRRTNYDMSAGIGRNIFTPISRIKKADRTLKNVLNNPNATAEDVSKAYRDTQKERLEGFKELRGVLELYKDMGYSIEGLAQDITLGGKKRQLQPSELQLIYSADQNTFVPTDLKARDTFAGPQADIPYEEINTLYEQLYNSRIDPNG